MHQLLQFTASSHITSATPGNVKDAGSKILLSKYVNNPRNINIDLDLFRSMDNGPTHENFPVSASYLEKR